jgi:hypothetical protein
MQALVLGTRFLLELCLLAALVVGGWALGGGGVLGVLLAAALAVAGAAVWGIWIGPKSGWRLQDPTRLVLEVALFVLGGMALWAGWSAAAGIALAIASTVVAVLTRMVGEPAPGGEQ